MNPYLIHGPALIGVSGGRTSGMLLGRILEAHGGTLPDDVRVVFTNTGREHEGTLRFVREMGERWGVPIHWIEWRVSPAQAASRNGLVEWLAANDPTSRMVDPRGWAPVTFDTASRAGEPFAALVAMKRTTPNGRRAFCTIHLKIEPARALALSWGWEAGHYLEPIGMRADEKPGRVAKAAADAAKYGRRTVYPLACEGIEKADVLAWWARQPFDLDIPQGFGNCDLCFKKGKRTRLDVIRREPDRAAWWIKREAETGYAFSGRDTMASLAVQAARSPMLPLVAADDEFDVECGTQCDGGEA